MDDEISLYDEFMADCQFEHDYPFGIPDERDPIWTTREGEEIRVADMTEAHIRNCMRIVGEDDVWYGCFKAELERRGLR